MDLETKLRKWFNEFDTVSFDVVIHSKKLEDLLNGSDTAPTENLLQKGDFNQDLQKSYNFVKNVGKKPQQPDDSILNLCDIFEVCNHRDRSVYGVMKVDTSDEIENKHFCKMVDLLNRTKYYDVNDKTWDDTGLNTPLSLACVIDEEYPNVKCIEMLLENGADTNIKFGITGDTILHEFLVTTKADDRTCLEVIRLFVKYGYNINTVSFNGYTLLHTCAKYSRIDLIEPLVELGVDINLKDVHGRDAFHVYNVFHIGFKFEYFWEEVDTFEEFINLGFDINQRDSNGCTILMLFVSMGAKTDKLTYVLHKGCVVNAVDKCGRTALHYFFTGELDLDEINIKVLIDAGADYLIKDKFQKTAFHYIVYKPQEQQVRCLSYIFTNYRQFFHQIDLKLRLDETVFLSRYNQVTKQLTELLSLKDYRESTENYFYFYKTERLTERNVSDILNTKGIGALEDFSEFKFNKSQVDLVMQRLATQLSKEMQFKLKVQCSGSVIEKCKVGLPDEFDYLFIIEGMERYFEIQPTQTPGFASVQKKTVEDFSEELFYFVNECGYTLSVCFLHYFGQKIFEVLQKTNIWEGTDLYWSRSNYEEMVDDITPKANFLFECRYHVPNFKDIDITIDVVPALPIPQDRSETFFVNKLELDSPKLLVLPTKSDLNSLHQCRISTSFIETSMILSLPRYLRNAFMLLKILNEHGRKYRGEGHYYSTTYLLKTALLQTSSRILETNRNLENNSDDIKLILEAASVMIHQYSKCKEDENMPSYFFKNNLLDF